MERMVTLAPNKPLYRSGREAVRIVKVLLGFDPQRTLWLRLLEEANELLRGPEE
jgi:hypothetical protein